MPVVSTMEHKGIQFQIVQMANPTGWIWTLELDEGRTKIGVSFSKANAIFNAISAIDKALSALSRAK
jgi:hypothetical protein